MSNEMWVDDGLVDPNSLQALKEMCAIAANRLRELRIIAKVGHDDVLDFAIDKLEAISIGTSPDQAFGFQNLSKTNNLAYRNWEITESVEARSDQVSGIDAARLAVSSEGEVVEDREYLLGKESIRKIHQAETHRRQEEQKKQEEKRKEGADRTHDNSLPQEIFPLTPSPNMRRYKK